MLGNLPSDWTTRSLSTGCFEDMPREAGLIPRVLGYIFQRIAADSSGGPNQRPDAGTRQLPLPPPSSAQACTTPVGDNARSRARSGIPTPNGGPRASYLTPPPASPQRTPETVLASKPPSGPSSRNQPATASGTEYLIKASMLQIYQEVVTDLLNPR
ncbi:hypothetical protein PLESTB_000811000 [Pleodorina starrii]|uniref:Kinesin motor domain-containing protein n=1 Tax=Pleodorina starrii TaxID=330485 RepID=A0A9W6BLK5_9CHLO|nr:hypothetical protein PLESTB_000811000 [Pleodorina starrii]GLC70263.1 hypothetical protein PLESTF_000949600 [Pleodorina starrii]